MIEDSEGPGLNNSILVTKGPLVDGLGGVIVLPADSQTESSEADTLVPKHTEVAQKRNVVLTEYKKHFDSDVNSLGKHKLARNVEMGRVSKRLRAQQRKGEEEPNEQQFYISGGWLRAPSETMEILSWNTRVLGNPRGIRTLRHMIKKKIPMSCFSKKQGLLHMLWRNVS